MGTTVGAATAKMGQQISGIETRKLENKKLSGELAGQQKGLDAAKVQLATAEVAAMEALGQKVGFELAGKPVPPAIEKKLKEAPAALSVLRQNVKDADALVSGTRAKIIGNQTELLSAEKDVSKATGGKLYGETKNVDTLEDAAALSPKAQEQLFGARVFGSPQVAAMRDVEKIKEAAKDKTMRSAARASAQMLAAQLDGGSAEFKAELVGKSAKLIESMAAKANGDPATAKALLDVIENTTGDTRKTLIKQLATHVAGSRTNDLDLIKGVGEDEVTKALGSKLKSGKGFDIAAELATELKAQGKKPAILAEVQKVTTGALKELRGEFESKQKVANRLDARINSFAEGWGPALSTDPKDAAKTTADAVQSFKKDHKSEYAARDAAAAKYLTAVDGLAGFPRMEEGPATEKALKLEEMSQKMLDRVADPQAALEAELGKLQKNLGPLFDTEPGKEKVAKAIDAQKLKQQAKPGGKIEAGAEGAWLQTLAESTSKLKDTNELRQNVQGLLSKGIARAALTTPDAYRAAELGTMLRNWKGPLGITEEGIKQFQDKTKVFYDPSRTRTDVGNALDALAEPDAKMKPGDKMLNGIGLMVALPSALESISTLGDPDAGLAKKLRAASDVTGFGNQALKVLFDSKVLDKFASRVNVAGNAVQLGQGIMALTQGKIIEGVSDTSLGLGGLMVAAGQLGSKIPGLQVIGAGLMVVGTVVGFFKKTDADKIEEAAEADLKKFLVRSGVPEEVADVFKDVAQRDGRNVGSFFTQAAARLNVTPKQLFESIAAKIKTEKSLVDKAMMFEMIEMIKAMPLDKDGKYIETRDPKDKRDTTQGRGKVPFGDDNYFGPRSMDTALSYMRDLGMLPPGK